MPGSNDWEKNFKAGRDNANYSPYVTPDGVSDAGAYHAGGQSATSWASTYARQKASAIPAWPSSSAPSGASVSGPGEGSWLLLVLSIPPLVPPGMFLYFTWLHLTGEHWGTWYKVAALGGEVALLGYGLSLFFRFTPSIIAALVTSIYMTATYTGAANYFEFSEFWTGIVIVAAGATGFVVGEDLSSNPGFGSRADFYLKMLLMVIGGLAVVYGKEWAISGGEPHWVVHQIAWWGGIGVAVGIWTFLVWYPGKTLLLAACAAGTFIWINHPEFIRSLLSH